MLVAGVDEAGRGCVIGPLVVAGVLVKDENLKVLAGIGVKDSKLLSPKKREALAVEIAKTAESFHVLKLSPEEIDRSVKSGRKLHKLNRLEAQTMTRIIEVLKPEVVYVDAADVNADRFKYHIQEGLSFKTRIISEHKSDRVYPVVSAASILAKVERDKEIAALKHVYGDFGSGYLTDPKTMNFLNRWLRDNPEYPECVRKSWKPARKAKNAVGAVQKRLA